MAGRAHAADSSGGALRSTVRAPAVDAQLMPYPVMTDACCMSMRDHVSKEASCNGMGQCYAELDIDVRWAGEPDVLLKLEPSNKWLMNAVKIGLL